MGFPNTLSMVFLSEENRIPLILRSSLIFAGFGTPAELNRLMIKLVVKKRSFIDKAVFIFINEDRKKLFEFQLKPVIPLHLADPDLVLLVPLFAAGFLRDKVPFVGLPVLDIFERPPVGNGDA